MNACPASILLFLCTISSTHASAQSVATAPELPSNLVVPEVMAPLVTKMWQQSLTFRRQCAKVAENLDVSISIALARGVRNASGARALVQRHGARLDVSIHVELTRPERFVEHIAHELEHVLEQMDGIDLPRLARQGVAGVVLEADRYETARAQAIGRMVALETLGR
jgi:hypothetical protein